MDGVFFVPRLEGRALEHAMFGFSSHAVLIYDGEAQTWVKVADIRAKLAMAYMQKQAATLRDELKSAGLAVQGADRPVRVNGPTASVDLRVWVKDRSTEALLEMTWNHPSVSGRRPLCGREESGDPLAGLRRRQMSAELWEARENCAGLPLLVCWHLGRVLGSATSTLPQASGKHLIRRVSTWLASLGNIDPGWRGSLGGASQA